MSNPVATSEARHSERVSRLFAAMLKVLVRTEFAYEMRDGEALDLSHHGSLSDALLCIRRRVEINQEFPDSDLRIRLAVQEAAILTRLAPGTEAYAQEQILTAREAAFKILDSKRRDNERMHQVQSSLRRHMAEIKSWGRNYSRFVSRMDLLYGETIFQLKLLNLDSELRQEAVVELEAIFEAALETDQLGRHRASRPRR